MNELLKKSGFSNKAIRYFLEKVNVGSIKNPTVSFLYADHCGDAMKIYLKIDNDIITDAKFEAIGRVGIFSAGSSLMVIAQSKSITDAENIIKDDIIEHLRGFPKTEADSILFVKQTFEMTLRLYKEKQLKNENCNC